MPILAVVGALLSAFKPRAIRALGKRELMHAIVFGGLLILALAFS